MDEIFDGVMHTKVVNVMDVIEGERKLDLEKPEKGLSAMITRVVGLE